MGTPLMLEIEVEANKLIDVDTPILAIGSCFAESMGLKMRDHKLNVIINPWGILYNPISISSNLLRAVEGKPYLETDLFYSGELWKSWSHHGWFSGVNQQEVLVKMNRELQNAHAFFKGDQGMAIITFGTAWVHTRQDEVVANCHKEPASTFNHSMLSVQQVVDAMNLVLEVIPQNLKVVFTVSPVRYLREGIHQSQLSKSTLLLAVDELTKNNPRTFYFPAYELVIDGLRDYRFYNEDLVHPNQQAVDYVWDKFQASLCTERCLAMIQDWKPLHAALNHKLLYPETSDSRKFLNTLDHKLLDFEHRFNVSTSEERKAIAQRLIG